MAQSMLVDVLTDSSVISLAMPLQVNTPQPEASAV